MPEGERGVNVLEGRVRSTMKRVDEVVIGAGEVTRDHHAASNYWNGTVSVFLRDVLTQRFFKVPLLTYLMIRAALDHADRDAFVRLDDESLTDDAPDPEAWVPRILEALGQGQALVIVDPARATPPRGWSLLDHLGHLGVRVTPVPLRGQRPRAVR